MSSPSSIVNPSSLSSLSSSLPDSTTTTTTTVEKSGIAGIAAMAAMAAMAATASISRSASSDTLPTSNICNPNNSHDIENDTTTRPWEGRIRKRPVSFGNPALGTYYGTVYTLENEKEHNTDTSDDDNDDHDDDDNDDFSDEPNIFGPGSLLMQLQQQQPDFTKKKMVPLNFPHSPPPSSATLVERMVAMVDVPPEQVPEGILHLARCHRPMIQHLRIVIAEEQQQDDNDDSLQQEQQQQQEILQTNRNNNSSNNNNNMTTDQEEEEYQVNFASLQDAALSTTNRSSSSSKAVVSTTGTAFTSSPSLSASAIESAASIFAADEEMELFKQRDATTNTATRQQTSSSDKQQQQQQQQQHWSSSSPHHKHATGVHENSNTNHSITTTTSERTTTFPASTSTKATTTTSTTTTMSSKHPQHQQQDRTYLVLVQLSSQDDADHFVQDLHGTPYTSLDESTTCSVHHVVALEGHDGVSLMSRFFAAIPPKPNTSTSTNNTTSSFPEDQNCPVCLEHLVLFDSPTIITNVRSSSPMVVSRRGLISTTAATSATTSSSSSSPTSTLVPTTSSSPNNHEELQYSYSSSSSQQQQQQQQEKTSILTTVCNHTFHCHCLLQWQDSPCPVCRFDHSGLNEALSQCHVCGTTENNYVCLICGVISCVGAIRTATMAAASAASASATSSDNCNGPFYAATPACASGSTTATTSSSAAAAAATSSSSNQIVQHLFSSSHARQHYDETLHAYALDTETQHVWDFAGQGYVHRLLQNKDDGKLVEMHDPNNTTSQERSLCPGLSDAQEGEVVHRKLEGFASQYYTLLKSQLEQQRIFYEGRLEEVRREYGVPTTTATATATHEANNNVNNKDKNNNNTTPTSTQDLLSALRQERRQLSQRLVSINRKIHKVMEDVGFLKSMNESLEANKAPLQAKVLEAQRQQKESQDMIQTCIPELEEKVRILMMQLEETSTTTNSNNNNNNNKKKSTGSTLEDVRKPAPRTG